jgi:hypothetical protein
VLRRGEGQGNRGGSGFLVPGSEWDSAFLVRSGFRERFTFRVRFTFPVRSVFRLPLDFRVRSARGAACVRLGPVDSDRSLPHGYPGTGQNAESPGTEPARGTA